jgi:hypothetical protein
MSSWPEVLGNGAIRGEEALRMPGGFKPMHPSLPLAEELLRRFLVPTTLDENIQDVAVLIDSPPQVMPFAIDRQKHLIQMPFVARSRAPAMQVIGLAEASLPKPTVTKISQDHVWAMLL